MKGDNGFRKTKTKLQNEVEDAIVKVTFLALTLVLRRWGLLQPRRFF